MKYPIILSLLTIAATMQAQDTYTNERITNNSSDVIGTARYVGMGGAMGALGSDISTISWNPAGIALIRKSEASMSFGGTWGKSHIPTERTGKATFDQAGFVANLPTGNDDCPYLNFAFNYQKKINFNNNYTVEGSLGGLSQLDELAELTDFEKGQYNLEGLAYANGYFAKTSSSDTYWRNKFRCGAAGSYVPQSYRYMFHSEGSLQGFDFNLSANIKNRVFLGVTFGVDNMRYRGYSYYDEAHNTTSAGTTKLVNTHELYDDYSISGYGFNGKFGAIIRPVEDNSFRFALVIETPTWYHLRSTTDFDLTSYGENYAEDGTQYTRTPTLENYLKFNLRSPWKFRTGIGSTLGNFFAWDIDYEYALYDHTSMGYPAYENYDGTTGGNISDKAMNQLTRYNLRGTHTLRAGIEVKPTKALSLRVGYNLTTSAYRKHDLSYDQYNLDSEAMNYAAGTCYMRTGSTNILTLGAGYRVGHLYFDLAYKVRNQQADFYAFDDSFAQDESGSKFITDNPELKNVRLDSSEADLTRHSFVCTVGYKF